MNGAPPPSDCGDQLVAREKLSSRMVQVASRTWKRVLTAIPLPQHSSVTKGDDSLTVQLSFGRCRSGTVIPVTFSAGMPEASRYR